MAKFETIYRQVGLELEETARLNKGQVPKALFDRLVAENFGCSTRTLQSYTRIFRTFGVIRPVNKSWYQFQAWSPARCEDDEREAIAGAVKA